MVARKIFAYIILFTWLTTLSFLAGPIRWRFAHTYKHLIAGMENNLPELTKVLGLAILGIGPSYPGSILLRISIWGFSWLAPIVLLVGVWRAQSKETISDCLVYGGATYCSFMFLLVVVLAVSLWLPFALT